jgi:hypothetical protein
MTMRLRSAVLAISAAALVATATGHAHDNRLRVEVWPRVSSAPATIRVRAIVEPNAENRGLEVAADSGDFYRSSYVPIAGMDAASITETTLKNLPGGDYQISVVLMDAQGRQIVERTSVMVASNGPGR